MKIWSIDAEAKLSRQSSCFSLDPGSFQSESHEIILFLFMIFTDTLQLKNNNNNNYKNNNNNINHEKNKNKLQCSKQMAQ